MFFFTHNIRPSKNVLHAQLEISDVFLKGDEFPEGPYRVKIIGVSSYEKEQLTFTVEGPGGWIYTYLPTHYLSLGEVRLVTEYIFLCPSIEFVLTNPLVDTFNTVHGQVKALFAIDWLDKNELAHCGYIIDNGAFVVYTHRNFKVENCPPLKKMRKIWK